MNNELDTGELQIKKVFEDTIRHNVNTVIDYTNETRNLVRDLDLDVKRLSKLVITQNNIIDELKKQLSVVQQKLYSKGT